MTSIEKTRMELLEREANLAQRRAAILAREVLAWRKRNQIVNERKHSQAFSTLVLPAMKKTDDYLALFPSRFTNRKHNGT